MIESKHRSDKEGKRMESWQENHSANREWESTIRERDRDRETET